MSTSTVTRPALIGTGHIDWDNIDIEYRQEAGDEVLCTGCAQPGGVEVVIGGSELSAWHLPCLRLQTVQLQRPFSGTWGELEALLPAPVELSGPGQVA